MSTFVVYVKHRPMLVEKIWIEAEHEESALIQVVHTLEGSGSKDVEVYDVERDYETGAA